MSEKILDDHTNGGNSSNSSINLNNTRNSDSLNSENFKITGKNNDDFIPPKAIDTLPDIHRVSRPLRHVKYIPTKALVFYSIHHPPQFTYDIKLKPPGSNNIIVQVLRVGLNPVDLKIYNSYTTNMNSYTGLGREYYGTISAIGSKVDSQIWSVGDEVFGTFFHPNLGTGTLQSSITIDLNKDVILKKPTNLNKNEAAGALYCLGTAYSILHGLEENQKIKPDSNILINGGLSSVAIFALQLLKNYYKVTSKIVLICSGSAELAIKKKFPEYVNDLIFINYQRNLKIYKPLQSMINDGEFIDYDATGKPISIKFQQGKFNIILDFVGGYSIIEHSNSLIAKGADYITTVGDYKANYKSDIYNAPDNPSANVRKVFSKALWNFSYSHFHFDPNAKYVKYYGNWPENCCELLRKGVVKTVIDRTYDWKDYAEAFKYLRSRHAHGKLILKLEKF
ncbi:related to Protein AST1 [Saccharomycodes ludwigii]|uniref:Related to Protein AST1 n=1 Tax=Saccharomycodes ludwigii TaxID=36035 RepID=A0A376B3B9_9ASCO|nr:hypothetical protein SCDLUD_000177 [Saccharomycodes ludwigii]KAH3902597.1 hypothetical protein SCDLUD_000177 [Saccharomycodes ludwigii]SSD58964.1 related to Protein AST1 [Saccharomycodes ludwigii]